MFKHVIRTILVNDLKINKRTYYLSSFLHTLDEKKLYFNKNN